MIYWLAFLFNLGSTDFVDDLKKVTDHNDCEPKCVFNYSEITPTTIKQFPSCSEVCGILVFNSNTDLTEDDLRDVFKSMQSLFGGIVLENSQLTTLSFFSLDNLYGEFNFFCEDYGFFIKNNSFLTDISTLNGFYTWTDDDFNECVVQIENNPKLDTTTLCSSFPTYTYMDIKTSGNLVDCGGCRGDQISVSNIKDYQNCEDSFGGLKLLNLNGDLSSLSKIIKVNGFIDIQNTDLKDLSFLKNLEYIQMKNIGLSDKISINIKNNPKMTRLGISAFKSLQFDFDYNRIANLENLHPDFCLTVEEMINFIELNLFFANIHSKYCDDVGNLQGQELCRFDKMSNLKRNCEYIFGDVLVENGDEEYVKKLNRMMYLFGSITIRNTKLKNLDFLSELRFIGTLDESVTPIQIISNPNLSSASLTSLLNIISKNKKNTLLENNPLLNSSDSLQLFPSIFKSKVMHFETKYQNDV